MQSVISCKRDIYCWVCHMESPLLKCNNCPRSFHRKCAYNMLNYPEPAFDSEGTNANLMEKCPECLLANKTALENLIDTPKAELKKILTIVTKNLKDGYFWPNPFYKLVLSNDNMFKDVVAKVVDISLLEDMLHQDMFYSLEGFLGEFKWILHNSIVVNGRCSKETESATEIMNLCKLELMAVDLCPECYLKERTRETDLNWFIKPCLRQPHMLGWARLTSNSHSPFWPVKIMQKRGDSVTVYSFADYRRFDIPMRQCYLFSENPPKKIKGKRVDDFKRAMNEIKAHILQLERVVERVELADDGICLKSVSMSDALNRMFPDLKSKPKTVNSLTNNNKDELSDV